MNNPKISIALATYNGSRFLREQLDSLYSQTIPPFEIIVVDDCSKDGTIKILEEYHMKYGLVYYVNQQNMGVNANFFKVISLCKGDYICICDQDDIWLPFKIEETLKKMLEIENGKLALVTTKGDDINANGDIIGVRKIVNDTSDLVSNIFNRRNAQGCTMMLNRQLVAYALSSINKYGVNQNIMYDAYLGYIATFLGQKYNMALVTMHYRHHDANVCGRIKIHHKRRTLSEKFGMFWIYDDLIPEDRIPRLKYIYKVCNKDINDHRIDKYIQSLDSLYNDRSLLNGISIIFSFKEFPFAHRFFLCFKACYRKLGRTIFSHENN